MMFTPSVLTLSIHVEVWVVDVYTHYTYTENTCRSLVVGVYTHTPTVLTLIIHVEVWWFMFTPTILTLIIHVEVWWLVFTPTVLTLIIHVSRLQVIARSLTDLVRKLR